MVAGGNGDLQKWIRGDMSTHACTCLPEVDGISVDVLECNWFLLLYRILEGADILRARDLVSSP